MNTIITEFNNVPLRKSLRTEEERNIVREVNRRLDAGDRQLALALLSTLSAGTDNREEIVKSIRLFGGSAWAGDNFVMVSSGGCIVRIWDEKFRRGLPDFAKKKKNCPNWAK